MISFKASKSRYLQKGTAKSHYTICRGGWTWRSPERSFPTSAALWNFKKKIYKKLKQCWESLPRNCSNCACCTRRSPSCSSNSLGSTHQHRALLLHQDLHSHRGWAMGIAGESLHQHYCTAVKAASGLQTGARDSRTHWKLVHLLNLPITVINLWLTSWSPMLHNVKIIAIWWTNSWKNSLSKKRMCLKNKSYSQVKSIKFSGGVWQC